MFALPPPSPSSLPYLFSDEREKGDEKEEGALHRSVMVCKTGGGGEKEEEEGPSFDSSLRFFLALSSLGTEAAWKRSE